MNVERQRLENGLNNWINESPPEEKISREEAAEKILRCFDQKSSDLILFNLKLTSLPSVISQLNQLRKLELSNNQLSELPEEDWSAS